MDGLHQIEVLEAKQFLNRQGIAKLYPEAGDRLHKGSLKKLLKPKMPHVVRFPEIVRWTQQIHDLLSIHMITFLDAASSDAVGYICSMRAVEAKGHVMISVFSDRPPT